jgi:hypothetical protein
MSDAKVCKTRGVEKPLTAYRVERRVKDGRQAVCIECRTAKERERWTTAPQWKRDRQAKWLRDNREKHRESDRAWRRNNPGKIAAKSFFRGPEPDDHTYARRKVREAIKRGELTRPDKCERCGSQGLVHGHHHDYSKPLSVEWLCPSCHRNEHVRLEKSRAA